MIKIDNISKKVGTFSVSNINFKIKRGEYFVILGPTGAGKTVILEIIAGLLTPDSGRIYLKGEDATDFEPDKRRIGMLYQDYMLFPHYTVSQNIGYGLKVRKVDRKLIKKKVDEFCILFNISHIKERRPENLSGGEKQRVALARTLICRPQLVLLDEPFSSIDISTKIPLIKEIRALHKKEGLTFIHVTHDFEEALELADRICVVNNGSVIQVGNPEDIFKKPVNRFVADFVGIRNVFYGTIRSKNGIKVFSVNSLDIYVNTKLDGKCHLSIRPEDIIISNSKIVSSARNCFKGRITDIILKQFVCEVTVDIGVSVVLFITKKSYEELMLKPGKNVWVTFKTMETHIF